MKKRINYINYIKNPFNTPHYINFVHCILPIQVLYNVTLKCFLKPQIVLLFYISNEIKQICYFCIFYIHVYHKIHVYHNMHVYHYSPCNYVCNIYLVRQIIDFLYSPMYFLYMSSIAFTMTDDDTQH